MEGERRIFGLDALRATAILLVIIGHISFIDLSRMKIPFYESFGLMGVELFFVLSGFLIGGIIIRLLHTNRFNTFRDLSHFWVNRWFRTLPLYYLFFFFYCAIHGDFFATLQKRISYAYFYQNFAWNIPLSFFGQSWSLSIEEWFYLLFPLVLFVLYAVARLPMRGSVLSAALFFLVGSLLLRIHHGPEANLAGFDHVFRKWVIFRFDALMFGVLAAYLKYERIDIWNWMAAHAGYAFALFAALYLFTIFGLDLFITVPWLQLIFFPLVSLSVAMSLPFFAEWKQSASPLRAPVVWLAKSSYSLYLSHPIPLAIMYKFPALLDNHVISYPLTTVSIFATGALSYHFIEAPMMKLRQKWNDRFLAQRKAET